MSSPKTRCRKCDVEILQTTADSTDGLCMPCKKGRFPPPDPNEPVEVLCSVDSGRKSEVVFFTTAQELLIQLDETGHIGDSSHPNKVELDAQKALLRHAMKHRVKFRLHDDHWGRTGYALLALFEAGKATLQMDSGRRYCFSELIKEDWRQGNDFLGSHGGFLYRDTTGVTIFEKSTWRS